MSGLGGVWSRFLESSRKNMDINYAAKRWPGRMLAMLPWLGAAFVIGLVVYFVAAAGG